MRWPEITPPELAKSFSATTPDSDTDAPGPFSAAWEMSMPMTDPSGCTLTTMASPNLRNSASVSEGVSPA